MNIQDLKITPDIVNLLSEIDEFKGEWKHLSSLSPDYLKNLRKVATIESIGSSTRIEGVSLTDSEIEKLLGGLNIDSFKSRDEEEVSGYASAIDLVFQNYLDIQLSENYIKQLHSELLRYSTKDYRHRGEYKKFPNNVEAFNEDGKSLGIIFKTSTPFDTPLKVRELVHWTRESLEDKSLHPLIVISIFIVTFLAIHPFQDGNGRLSRILTTLLLLKSGYLYCSYSSLESIVEKNKQSYYLSLRKTQASLEDNEIDWLPWLRFFLTALKKQKIHLQIKLESTASYSTEDLSSECIEILEYTKKYGKITVARALTTTQIPRPTVKKRLSELVKKGYLKPMGKGRGAYYKLLKS